MYELLAKLLFLIKASTSTIEEPISVDQDIRVSTWQSLYSSGCAVQKKETYMHI